MSAPRPPDILYVVLDCARATDLNTGQTALDQFPNWAKLVRQSVTFDHAVAPASWTLPSHASMFTGVYPWEHRVLHGGETALGTEFSTLADALAGFGYATGCFSANPLLGRHTGLVRGFQTALSGRFLDCYLRPIAGQLSGPIREHGPARHSMLKRLEHETGHSLRASIKKGLLFYPAPFDVVLRALAQVRSGGQGLPSEPSPWIEPCVASWADSLDPRQPCFAFVNLLDAHEPYLGLPERVESWKEWYAQMSVRQDSLQQFFGSRMPSGKDLRVLHRLYREALKVADRRLGRLIDAFASRRDPENTLIVVTSDHGQAFGEGGQVYHGRGTTDEIVRVPLAVRFPERLGFRGVVSDWFSTSKLGTDIVLPSIEDASRGRGRTPYAGPKDSDAAEPVFAISDNYDSHTGFGEVSAPFSGSLAAFQGTMKVELRLPGHELRVFDEQPASVHEVGVESSDRTVQSVVQRLRRIATSHLQGVSPTQGAAWARLASWGYDS